MVSGAYGAARGLRNLSLALALGAGAAAAEPVVVAALGDSLTAGYGLLPEQGFVPQLQNWLTARGAEVEIRNAGVSGDTTQGGLSRVDWTLTADVDAMIVALGGNDLLRGIDPALTRANLDAILRTAQEKGVEVLLVGLSAPGNYGAEFKRDFDAAFPELAEEYGALYADSFFRGLADAPGRQADYLQPDGIHPNAEGVRLIVEGLGPGVLDLIERAAQ